MSPVRVSGLSFPHYLDCIAQSMPVNTLGEIFSEVAKNQHPPLPSPDRLAGQQVAEPAVSLWVDFLKIIARTGILTL